MRNALDRPASGVRLASISVMSLLIDISFSLAMSRRASQKGASSDTDVRCPEMETDRLTSSGTL